MAVTYDDNPVAGEVVSTYYRSREPGVSSCPPGRAMSRVTAAPRGASPDRFPPAPGGYYSLPSQTLSAGLTAAGFPAALSWLRGLGQRFRCGPARAAGAWALVLAFPAVVSSAGAADGPPALTRLAVPEGEAAGWRLYPAFDPAVRHYALRCGYRDALTLRLSAADPDTRLTVNGQPVAGHAGEAVLAGLAGDGDVVIRLRRGGASSSYVLHCLADDFPEIAATSRPGVSDGLILVSVWMQDEAKAYFSWIAMIDNHGVPRFRRRIDRLANSFKPHRNADFPFSYGREAGYSENPRDASWRSFEFVLLDRALEPRRVVEYALDPASGEELLAVRIEHDGELLSSQAYHVGFEALEGAPR